MTNTRRFFRVLNARPEIGSDFYNLAKAVTDDADDFAARLQALESRGAADALSAANRKRGRFTTRERRRWA